VKKFFLYQRYLLALAALIFFVTTIYPVNKWQFDSTQCREQGGFCFAFLRAKFSYFFFGPYPRELLWRPIVLLLMTMTIGLWASMVKYWNRWFLIFYVLLLILYPLLMGGFGENQVPTEKWGGLPLSMMIILSCTGPGLVLGMILALGRRSKLPLFRWVATLMIELVRAVPLITLLFMASVMWPLFFPASWSTPKLVRAILVMTIFIAAYMAEVIRGGLQAIGPGQFEAAKSLGLNFYQTMRLIILPQAIGHVIKPLVNTIIGMSKDTSLVMIIALFDFMGAVKSSLSDMDWPGYSVEAYLFAAIVYYAICRYLSWMGDCWEIYFQRGKNI
jgi:general L-amino acid transport system permease protein